VYRTSSDMTFWVSSTEVRQWLIRKNSCWHFLKMWSLQFSSNSYRHFLQPHLKTEQRWTNLMVEGEEWIKKGKIDWRLWSRPESEVMTGLLLEICACDHCILLFFLLFHSVFYSTFELFLIIYGHLIQVEI
jgi:hypothetical protein